MFWTMFRMVFLIFFIGSAALAADQFSYERKYQIGEQCEYLLTRNYYLNTQWQHKATAAASLVVVETENLLADQVQWLSLLKSDVSGTTDLSAEAKKVDSYFMSLQAGGPLKVPPLKVPQMVGMITDFLTFFVAVSPHVGTPNVKSVGEIYVAPQSTKGDWSDGQAVIIGEDCIHPRVEMTDLNSLVVTYKTSFLAPTSDQVCITMNKDWMVEPVDVGTPNNFQQITSDGSGKFNVMWGHEFFVVTSQVERATGKLLSANMDNYLNLRMKTDCSTDLEGCQSDFPLTIRRALQLEIQR